MARQVSSLVNRLSLGNELPRTWRSNLQHPSARRFATSETNLEHVANTMSFFVKAGIFILLFNSMSGYSLLNILFYHYSTLALDASRIRELCNSVVIDANTLAGALGPQPLGWRANTKEISMKSTIVSGATLAVAAIALAASGISPTPAAAKKASVHCVGINSCKGTSACKTAENACKGQNSCKGHGWLPAKSKGACEAKGGTVG
jgi:hypothetical protein